MYKLSKTLLLTVMFFLTLFISAKVLAETAGLKLILFCTSWSYNCREAKQTLNSLESTYGGKIKVQMLDVDQPSTPEASLKLGVSVPNVVPYIYILDKKGKVLGQKVYKNENTQDLKQYIDRFFEK